MSDTVIIDTLTILWRFAKWYVSQYILLFFVPFLWQENLCTGLAILIGLYTFLYSLFWEQTPKGERLSTLHVPYVIYLVFAVVCCLIWSEYFPSFWVSLILPMYGAFCFVLVRLIKRFLKKGRKMIVIVSIIAVLVLLKIGNVIWGCHGQGSFEGEKKELLQRRDYLIDKLVTPPANVLDEMPSGIGPQFQGEWALYSCSMTAKALANLSALYPETKDENLRNIARLIEIVRSPELRRYDKERWGEDPLESLGGDQSHVSYLSHLAWMIADYKAVGGDERYDELFGELCHAMNRRIVQSGILNLPTYPGESIYVPDMLVAIVALSEYSKMNGGEYTETVRQWLQKAATDWADKATGLLVSFLNNDGQPYSDAPVKGSYSALNCYYLALIDEPFARSQYEKFKTVFLQKGILTGVKEYHDHTCWFGLDIDAGPILFGLSPSGTAFALGPITFFGDKELRKSFLKTAEIAGHTIQWNNQRHYALANLALVGEAIMLAMRTTCMPEKQRQRA